MYETYTQRPDVGLASNSPDRRTDLIRKRHAFIPVAARYQVGARSVKCMELIRYESLEAIPYRLV
jgi:hypothetical protein